MNEMKVSQKSPHPDAPASPAGKKEALPHVDIYTDGASRGNPGPGGYGVVIRFTDASGRLHEKELSGGYRSTTNNRMEILAAVAGLEALKKPCDVAVFSDSRYLVDAVGQHWIEAWMRRGWIKKDGQPAKNISLWKRLVEARKPHNVRFFWVKGHDGNPLNERCDDLATSAAAGKDLPEDDLGD